MPMNVLTVLFPMLALVLWLGLAIYLLMLATRFVNAVEWIARSLARQAPDKPGFPG
jgi:hypothetical protein